MDSSKQSNKISDIVKLKRMLKKWRIQASSAGASAGAGTGAGVGAGDDHTGGNTSNNSTKKGSLTRTTSSNNIFNKDVDNNKNNDDEDKKNINNKSVRKGFLSRNNSNNNILINENNSSSNKSSSSNNSSNKGSSNNSAKKRSLSRSNSMKGINFLKRTLSFTDLSTSAVSSNAVPKGFLAVHVGEGMKRFVIPTNYLKHQAFCLLLKEAEDEFGFQQEGVLRIPCEVEVFENILRRVEAKNSPHAKQSLKYTRNDGIVCGSIESQSLSKSHHPPSPMCR